MGRYVEGGGGGLALCPPGLAQVWREKATEEAIRARILSDPHSPSQFRVNGIVRNLDDWYEAFDIQEDDDLYLPPDQRVRIW